MSKYASTGHKRRPLPKLGGSYLLREDLLLKTVSKLDLKGADGFMVEINYYAHFFEFYWFNRASLLNAPKSQ